MVFAIAREAARQTGANRLRWLRKARTVRAYGGYARDHLRYVLLDPELSNFTYDLGNEDELAPWLDELLGAGEFVSELEEDAELERELRARLRWRPGSRGRPMFGRRAGWYAIVRATRPERVVEAGTHDGLGSIAILAAIERNGVGELVSIDPKPWAGWLVPKRLHRRWRRLRVTSYEVLESIGRIDLFIHDSLHTPECESWELTTALQLGAQVLISDNAHASDTCAKVAEAHDAHYSVWRERVAGHFYPGGGIGVIVAPTYKARYSAAPTPKP